MRFLDGSCERRLLLELLGRQLLSRSFSNTLLILIQIRIFPAALPVIFIIIIWIIVIRCGHFLAAFADCVVAAARVENGLCFQPLACFPGTPVGFVEVGAVPQPLGAPPPGAAPTGGTAPQPPWPTATNSFIPFLLTFGVCFSFILNSETH